LAAARYIETLDFGEPTLEVVVAANTAYRTQFPDLFAGSDDLRRASREYAQRIGSTASHAERYWFC
jgi:hypothetical protein